MKVHIIGGGIIGMSTAYHLVKQGVEVVVFEKDPAYTESSFARSCGGFRAQYFTKTNIQMSKYSIDFIKNNTDVEFTSNGYLMLFGKDQKSDCDASTILQRSEGASTVAMAPNDVSGRFDYLNVDDLYRGCITTDGSEGWCDPVTLHKWYKDNTKCETLYIDGRELD